MTLSSKAFDGQGLQEQFGDADPTLLAALPLLKNGFSVYAAAEELNCARSTLREQYLAYQEIDLPVALKEAFISTEGRNFLKRMSIAAHLQFRNLCACGLRQIKDFFIACGLDKLIGVSVGSQWNLSRKIDEAIVEFGAEEYAIMKPAVQGKSITAALDENFHEGPCLVAIEPASNFILVEEAASSRDTADWQNAFAPVLALLGVKITQVTSDSGSSIIALCEKAFEAHHSPDLFHILFDFRRTFKPFLRAAYRNILSTLCASEREEEALLRMENKWAAMTSAERGRGRPPDFDKHLDAQEKIQERCFKSLAELEKGDLALKDALRSLSQAYHPVSIETGTRTGRTHLLNLASVVAAQAQLLIERYSFPEEAPKALEKFLRMVEKMASTLDYIATLWRERATVATSSMQERCCLESKLVGAAYLERIAKTQGTLKRHEILAKAQLLKSEAAQIIGEAKVAEIYPVAMQMASDFQRSSSMVEGRNGVLSLRHHAFHDLSPLKRKVLTALHNHVVTRADGTTAAERFSNVKSRNLMDWLCRKIPNLPKAGGKKGLRLAA